jgi:adenosylcobinamide kinase/adenosylcobinamide-phosphate guanylyltransferase
VSAANRIMLVLGGQRSGKSAFAENLVQRSGTEALYVATATAGDDEMTARIRAHQTRRGAAWRNIEEPLDLTAVLRRQANARTSVLVDCLTLWLSNVIAAERHVGRESEALVEVLSQVDGAVVLVSGEVGLGVIPDNRLGRSYADALGTLNQRIAAIAGRVVLVVAGQPIILKPAAKVEFSL